MLHFRHDIELDDTWDVIIAGGGPAGCAAAAAAARSGAKTLLLEAQGALGGMGTCGLIPAWCPFSDGEKIIYRGIAKEVFDASKEGVPFEPADKLDWVAINPEHLKRVYDKLLKNSGVTVLFFHMLAAVECDEEKKVTALITASKDGLRAFSGKVYIDCTGDGDLAYMAGAEFKIGSITGELQPSTLCFQLSGVDINSYLNGPALHTHINEDSPIWDALASGRYPLIPDEHICQNQIGASTVGFNAGHLWNVNNCDSATVSPAMSRGRLMADEYRKFLADKLPEAFGKSFVSETASLMGIRETRRITGDYILTVEDYYNRASFDDEIGRNAYYLDIHASADNAIRHKQDMPLNFAEGKYRPGESHGIPYRCLLPRKLNNVLVAGRCISTDRAVNGSTRVMPVCLVTGEAAGTAAGIAVEQGTNPRDVDTCLLRSRLRQNGAWLPEGGKK
jgi:hypothetical protein